MEAKETGIPVGVGHVWHRQAGKYKTALAQLTLHMSATFLMGATLRERLKRVETATDGANRQIEVIREYLEDRHDEMWQRDGTEADDVLRGGVSPVQLLSLLVTNVIIQSSCLLTYLLDSASSSNEKMSVPIVYMRMKSCPKNREKARSCTSAENRHVGLCT